MSFARAMKTCPSLIDRARVLGLNYPLDFPLFGVTYIIPKYKNGNKKSLSVRVMKRCICQGLTCMLTSTNTHQHQHPQKEINNVNGGYNLARPSPQETDPIVNSLVIIKYAHWR